MGTSLFGLVPRVPEKLNAERGYQIIVGTGLQVQ